MNLSRIILLFAILALLIVVPQVPATRKLPIQTRLFQQNISYQFSGVSQGPLLSLSFNFTGHDPGSDFLELTVYFSGPVPPLACQQFGSPSCGTVYLLNSTGGPTIQNVLFASPCVLPSSLANCGTIHYGPITVVTIYVFLDVSVTGSATITVEGRHTWTVTTLG